MSENNFYSKASFVTLTFDLINVMSIDIMYLPRTITK